MKTEQNRQTIRQALAQNVLDKQERLKEICIELVRTPSENPPGDTRDVANVAQQLLSRIPGVEVQCVAQEEPIVNVIARLKGGAGPGRRLVFNGHLDTFPAGDVKRWSVSPFSGHCEDGRIYGRGVSDMKGGIACSLLALELLAEQRQSWRGEIVVTLAGDEETMGRRGTFFLLNNYEHASGDAMICGDAGSPRVLRFGEKGMVWVKLKAVGRTGHGAHVHLGDNAIERLITAINRLLKLRNLRVDAPAEVKAAIRRARAVSEPLSGKGEARTLGSITVNCGTIYGGSSANLIPDEAGASLDLRVPVGFSAGALKTEIARRLDGIEGVGYSVFREYDPTWTDPNHEVIRLLKRAGREVLGRAPAVNMRVGASDSRLYRMRGLAAVVCGLTPHNMGRPDEYITLDDLHYVSHMHTLAAYDFLTQEHKGEPDDFR